MTYFSCTVCSKVFSESRSIERRYCGKTCRAKAATERAWSKQGAVCVIKIFNCKVCGELTLVRRRDLSTCSKECSEARRMAYFVDKKRNRTFEVFARDGFRCVYCGKSSIEDQVKLEADHIIPRIVGGGDEASNMVTACKPCNRAKGGQQLSIDTLLRIREHINSLRDDKKVSYNK